MRSVQHGYALLMVAAIGCGGPAQPAQIVADARGPDADVPAIDVPLIDARLIDAPLIDAPLIDAPPIDAPPGDAPDEGDTLASMCGGAVPTTVDEWEACYLKRYCEMRVHCGEKNLFTDAQECIDHVDGLEGGRLSFERFEKKRAVAAHRASIDPVAFETCLRAWSPKGCNTATTEPACALRYVGTVTDAQGCYSDVECISPGATCEPQSCDDSCCLGACTPKGKLGDTCMSFTACEPTLQCSPGTLKCVTGAIGSSCTLLDCEARGWCDASDHICKADVGERAPCTDITQCGGETSCVGLRRTVGSATCRRITQAGDACDWFCFGNLYCDLSSPTGLGVCTPLPTLGQSGCSLLVPCLGRLNRCDSNGQCVGRDQVDQSCTDGMCMPGLFCTDQLGAASPVCSAPMLDGTSGCNQDSQCQSHICDGNQTTPGDCRPLRTTCP